MQLRNIIRPALIAVLAALTIATPALAHEGMIGDGGPFRIELTEPLPTEIDARWGNGELELHVPAGMEIVAIGVDGEPFAKVDAEGNMFANEKSPTWWMSKGDKVPASADPTATPEWVWVKGGGSLQYHDHRIHFMAASLDPALEDGAAVFEFTLPFVIDGADVSAKGALVFDSTLDPDRAAALKSSTDTGESHSDSGMEMTDSDTEMADSDMEMTDTADMTVSTAEESESSSGTIIVVAVAVIATLLAGAAVVIRSRR